MGRESRISQAAMTHHIAYRQAHQPPSWQEQGLTNARFVYCVGETALSRSCPPSSQTVRKETSPSHFTECFTHITEALKVLFKRDDEFKAWLGPHANEQNRRGALTKTA
jgi:hypothetical protein